MFPRLVRTGFIEEVYETEEAEVNTENELMRMAGSEFRKVDYRLTAAFDRFYEMILRGGMMLLMIANQRMCQ